jgi:hypothetical protein
MRSNVLIIGEVAGGLAELARMMVLAGRRHFLAPRRRRRGGTLRPGPETPLWNALAATVRPHLRRYGAKSNLGRMLAVSPQRVHLYFKANSAMPDAEQVLQLLVWLSQGAPVLAGPKRKPWRRLSTGRFY